MSTTTTRPTARRARSNGTIDARVIAEPLTYDLRANPGASYFADKYRSTFLSDPAAQARLERHESEMHVELRAREAAPSERRYKGDVIEPAATFERRTTWTSGPSTPPLWLVDQLAIMPRANRVLADLVPSFPLPKGVSSVNIPRLTVGTSARVTPPATPVPEGDFQDAATYSPCASIPGFLDVPLPMLEQSGRLGAHLDQLVWRDLLSAYDEQLEIQMWAGLGGTGPNAQLLGVTNVPGIASVVYTDASPTAVAAYAYLGQVYGSISDARKIRPECWAMRGGRWAWWCTSEDEEMRPLGVPDAHNPPPVTPDGVPDPAGALLGLPVFTSEAIPRSLPAPGGSEDEVIGLRPSDLLLWESEPQLATFTEPVSGTLEARIRMHTYCAFIGGRWPSGISTLTGTGMTVPAGE
jgi:hypothetical protein